MDTKTTPTNLLYLSDFNALVCKATVLEVLQENNKTVIIFDQTVFYPQGGGQPYDTGTITKESGIFRVDEVRFVDGMVKHIGVIESGNFVAGNNVECHVNPERRNLNCRAHSGGHVIDMAVASLKLDWVPGKGFHFPEGPYVEYSGQLPGDDKEREALKQQLELIANNYINKAIATKLMFANKAEMHKLCRFVPENLPENKPSRVVLYGDFGVPCGGTHVNNLKDIGHLTIRKLKMEKGNIRVSYAIA